MIIRKIRIKNINSLKNEHLVDFTTSPLKDSGLFAITGPTGSGKTTILDAICLALFNRIPRIDKAISQKLILDTGVILTRNTKEAFAEVEFACARGIYTSRWEISTNRNGNLRDYEMRIYDASGDIIEEKKTNVPSLNEMLVGLNFDQFIRSILLPQGDFALFLQSGKNERGLLLEKITGSLIYRELGKRAFEKSKEIRLQIEKVKERQGELASSKMEDSAFAELETKCDSIEKEQTDLNNNMVDLKKQLAVKQGIERLTKQTTDTKQLWEKSEQEITHFQNGAGIKIERHKALSPYFEEINTISEIQNQIVDTTRKLNLIRENISENKTKIVDATQKIHQFINNKTVKPEYLIASLDAFEKQVADYSVQCQQKEFAYRTGFEPIKQAASELNLPIVIKEEPQKIAEKISARKQATIHRLSEFEQKYPKIGAENSSEKQELLQEQITWVNEWDKQEVLMQQYSKNFETLQKKLNDIENDHKTQQTNVVNWEAQYKILKTEYELKSKDLLINQLTNKLEDYKKHLHTNEPCPLCGSLEHPWATKEAPNSRKQEEECKVLSDSLTKLKSDIDSAKARVELFENQIKTLEKDKKDLKLEILQCKESIARLTIKLPDEIKPLTPTDALLKLKQKLVDYQEFNHLTTELNKIELLKTEISQLIELYTEGKAIRLKIQEIYQGNNIQTDCKVLRSKYQEVESEQHRLRKNAQELSTELEQGQTIINQKINGLTPHLHQLGYSDFEIAKQSMLTHDVYSKLVEQSQKLENEKLSHKTKYETLIEELQRIQKMDVPETTDQISTLLNQHNVKIKEIAQNRDSMKEQLSIQKSIRTELHTKAKQFEEVRLKGEKWILLDKLIGDAKGNEFNNFAQSLTLGHLIKLANRRLMELNPRYQLTKIQINGNEELNVIDRDMGNELRSVKTLSGGETFMVSLGLALGLAEMASRNIAIGSLFIDEGFGTLDPETLDQALAMLESLQALSNKTIGIISHVDALKERINSRIELVPEFGHGYSKLTIKTGYST